MTKEVILTTSNVYDRPESVVRRWEYAPTSIPLMLRTDLHAQLVDTGATRMPDDEDYDPQGKDRSLHQAVQATLQATRDRIETGELETRFLIGASALRNVSGLNPAFNIRTPASRKMVHEASLDLLARYATMDGYAIGLIGFANLNPLARGPLILEDLADGSSRMKQDTYGRDLVTYESGTPEGDTALERARRGFQAVWDQATTEPADIVKHLGQIISELREYPL